jgi:hypothetical protein
MHPTALMLRRAEGPSRSTRAFPETTGDPSRRALRALLRVRGNYEPDFQDEGGGWKRRCRSARRRTPLSPHAEEPAKRASRSTRASPEIAGSSFATQPAAAPQDEGRGWEKPSRNRNVPTLFLIAVLSCAVVRPFPSTEGRCREALRGWDGDRRLRL